MKSNKPSLEQRLEECRVFCIETSKLAGITKGLFDLSKSKPDAKARSYFRALFETHFKQLMIHLHILTQDSYSEIKIQDLIKDFRTMHEGRLKELGLAVDIEKEEEYRLELAGAISAWNSIRGNYAAHKKIGTVEDWDADVEDISIFMHSSCHIINTLTGTLAVPSSHPKETSFTSYSSVKAVNLE